MLIARLVAGVSLAVVVSVLVVSGRQRRGAGSGRCRGRRSAWTGDPWCHSLVTRGTELGANRASGRRAGRTAPRDRRAAAARIRERRASRRRTAGLRRRRVQPVFRHKPAQMTRATDRPPRLSTVVRKRRILRSSSTTTCRGRNRASSSSGAPRLFDASEHTRTLSVRRCPGHHNILAGRHEFRIGVSSRSRIPRPPGDTPGNSPRPGAASVLMSSSRARAQQTGNQGQLREFVQEYVS